MSKEYKIDITPPVKAEGEFYIAQRSNKGAVTWLIQQRTSNGDYLPHTDTTREVSVGFNLNSIKEKDAAIVLTQNGKEVGRVTIGELEATKEHGNPSVALRHYATEILNGNPNAKKSFKSFMEELVCKQQGKVLSQAGACVSEIGGATSPQFQDRTTPTRNSRERH